MVELAVEGLLAHLRAELLSDSASSK